MATDNQADRNKVYQLRLTPEQRETLRAITGSDGEAIELTAQELEQRIAPLKVKADGMI